MFLFGDELDDSGYYFGGFDHAIYKPPSNVYSESYELEPDGYGDFYYGYGQPEEAAPPPVKEVAVYQGYEVEQEFTPDWDSYYRYSDLVIPDPPPVKAVAMSPWMDEFDPTTITSQNVKELQYDAAYHHVEIPTEQVDELGRSPTNPVEVVKDVVENVVEVWDEAYQFTSGFNPVTMVYDAVGIPKDDYVPFKSEIDRLAEAMVETAGGYVDLGAQALNGLTDIVKEEGKEIVEEVVTETIEIVGTIGGAVVGPVIDKAKEVYEEHKEGFNTTLIMAAVFLMGRD